MLVSTYPSTLMIPGGGQVFRASGLRALGAVFRTALPARAHACTVERAAYRVIAHARQILHASAADHHDGVLLQVVSLAADVARDLVAVDEAHARDLAHSGVGLLRRRRVDARAHAALLGTALQRRYGAFLAFARARLAHELIHSRHARPGSRVRSWMTGSLLHVTRSNAKEPGQRLGPGSGSKGRQV